MTRLLAYLRSLLVSQVYVVLDGGQCVGVSGRLQGAELLRADHARALADMLTPPPFPPGCYSAWRACYVHAYDRQRVELHRLRDV